MAFNIKDLKKDLQAWADFIATFEKNGNAAVDFAKKYDTWNQTMYLVKKYGFKDPKALEAMENAYKAGRTQSNNLANQLGQLATLARSKGLELYVEKSPESESGRVLKLIPVKLMSQLDKFQKTTNQQDEKEIAQIKSLIQNAPKFDLPALDKFGRTISQHVQSQTHEALVYSNATSDIMSVQTLSLALNQMMGAIEKTALPSNSFLSKSYLDAFSGLAKQVRRIERKSLESMQMLSANRTKNLQLNRDLQGNFNASNAYTSTAQFFASLGYDVVPYMDQLWADYHSTSEFKRRYGHRAVYKKTSDVVAFQRDFADLIDTAIMYSQLNGGQKLFDSYLQSENMGHFKVAKQRLDKLFNFIQTVKPTYGVRSEGATGRLTLSKIQTATSPFISEADRKLTQNALANTRTARTSSFAKKNPFKPLLAEKNLRGAGEEVYYLRGEATQEDIFKAYEIYINGDGSFEGIGKKYGFSWDPRKNTIVFNQAALGSGSGVRDNSKKQIKDAKNAYRNLLKSSPWLENYRAGLTLEQGFFRSSLLKSGDVYSTYLDPKVIKPTDYQKKFDELSEEEKKLSEDEINLLIARRVLGQLASGTKILMEQPGKGGKKIPAITRTADGGLNVILEQKLTPHVSKFLGNVTGGIRLSGVALDDEIMDILINKVYGEDNPLYADAKQISFIRQKPDKIKEKNIYNYLDEAFRFLGIKISEKWEQLAEADDAAKIEEFKKQLHDVDFKKWVKKIDKVGNTLKFAEKPFNNGVDDLDLAIKTLNDAADVFIYNGFKFFEKDEKSGKYKITRNWIGAGEQHPAANERARVPKQISYGPKEARALNESLSMSFSGSEIAEFAPYLDKVLSAPSNAEYASKDEKGNYTGFYAVQLQNMANLAFKTMDTGASALKTMTLLDGLFSNVAEDTLPGSDEYLSTTGQIYMSRNRVEALPSVKFAMRVINDIEKDIKQGNVQGVDPGTDFLSALINDKSKPGVLQRILGYRYGIDIGQKYFTTYLNGQAGEKGYGVGQQLPLFLDLDLLKSVYNIKASGKKGTDNVLLEYSETSRALDRFVSEYNDIMQATELGELEKQKLVGDHVAALLETVRDEVVDPEGSYYKKYHKVAMAGSRMFNSRSLTANDDTNNNWDFIIGVKPWKKLMNERLNALSSEGSSEAEIQELTNALINAGFDPDKSTLLQDYKKFLLEGYSFSEDEQKKIAAGADEIDIIKKKRNKYRNKILTKIANNVVSGLGSIQMVLNRQPSITGSDVIYARGGLSRGKQYDDSIFMNPDLQRALNADDDGDIIASMVISANKDQFNKAYKFTQNVKTMAKILQASDLGLQSRYEIKEDETKATLDTFLDTYTTKGKNKEYDAFVAKQVQEGKRAIGRFSEFNNAVRNVLGQKGLTPGNWSSIAPANDDIFPGSGILYGDVLTSFLSVLEQDAISAKKIGETLKNSTDAGKRKKGEAILEGIKQKQDIILKAENWENADNFKNVLEASRAILGLGAEDNLLNSRMMNIITSKAFTIGGDYWKQYLTKVLGYTIKDSDKDSDDIFSEAFFKEIGEQISFKKEDESGNKKLKITEDKFIDMLFGTTPESKRLSLATRLGQATRGGEPIKLSDIAHNALKYKSPTPTVSTWVKEMYEVMPEDEKSLFTKYSHDPKNALVAMAQSGKYDEGLANLFTLLDWSDWRLGNAKSRYENFTQHLTDENPFFESFHKRAKSLGLSDYPDSDIGKNILLYTTALGKKYKARYSTASLLRTVEDLTPAEKNELLSKSDRERLISRKTRKNYEDAFTREFLLQNPSVNKDDKKVKTYVNRKIQEEEDRLADKEIQKRLDEEINKSIRNDFNILSTKGRTKILGGINNKDFKDALNQDLAITKGNMIHYFAEGLINTIQRLPKGENDSATIQKAVVDNLDNNQEYKDAEAQLVKLLRLSGLGSRETENEMVKIRKRALAQVSFLDQLKKEDIIGTEVDLFGRHGTVDSGGTADLLFRNKDNNIVVYDYKNTKSGLPVAGNFMQVLQYMQDVDSLKNSIGEALDKNGGNLTASQFLETTDAGKKLLKTYESRAITQLEYEKSKGQRQFSDAEEEQFKQDYIAAQKKKFIGEEGEFTGVYDALVDTIKANEGDNYAARAKNTKTVGMLGYTSASGTWSQYLLDAGSNQILQGALNKFDANKKFTSDDLDQILNAGKLLDSRVIEGYNTSAQTKEFKEYIRLLEEEKKLENDILVLDEKRAQYALHRKTELANGAQKSIDELKEELEIKKKATEESKKEVDRANKEQWRNTAERKAIEEEQKEIAAAVEQGQALIGAQKAQEDRETLANAFSKEYFQEYKELSSKKTQYELRKRELSRMTKDSLLPQTTRKALEEELKTVDDALNEGIKKRLDEIETWILQKSAASDDIKQRFVDIKKNLQQQYDDAIAEDDRVGEENYLRKKYKEQRAAEQEITTTLNQEAAAENRLKALNNRLRRGDYKSDNQRRILELEREQAQVQYDDAHLLAQELVTRYSDEKGQIDPRFAGVYDKVTKRLGIAKAIQEAQQQEQADREAKGNSGLFGGLGDSLSLYFKRFLGGGLIMRAMYKLRQEVQKVINQAKELDQVMTNVRIITNDSIEDTRNLMSEYSQLGKELGVTTKEVAQAGIAWMRQGYQAAEATKLITASLYLSKLGMIDNATATKSLTSALKGFKLEAAEAMSVVDKLTAIDLKAATSAGDIAEGLAQFANLGSLAGVDIDQAAAYVATIADVTQMSGSSAGQALKTIISRFGNVKAGAYNKLNVNAETADAGENLNDVEKVLNKIGISIRDTNLQFKDFDEVLSEIAEKWNSLDNVSKKAIANAFAGIRQQESFVTLLENWDKYEELVDVSKNSKGTAEMKYQSYQESLQASAEKLQATIEDLINKAEISSLLKVLTDLSQGMLEYLPKIIHWIPALISTVENIKLLTGNSTIQRILNNSVTKEGGMLFNISKRFNSVKRGYSEMEDFYKDKGEKHPKAKAGVKSLLEFIFGGEARGHDKARSAAEKKANEQITKEAERRAALAKKESQEKAEVVKNATVGKNVEKEKAALANQELLAGRDKLNLTTLEAMVARGELSTQEAIEKYQKQGGKSEREIEKLRKLGEEAESQIHRDRVESEGESNGGSDSGTLTEGKFSKILGVAGTTLSFIANQTMAAVSAYQTAGLSHKDSEGNTVTSSETAHIVGRNITTAMSLIPVFGQPIGERIAERVMKEIDAARDEASLVTQRANNRLNALKGIQSDFETIKKLAGSQKINDVTERNNAITSYINTMYLSENTELRHIIESYLSGISEDIGDINGNSLTLNSLMTAYQNADGKTQKRIVRALEIAQKKAELSQQQAARASENYAYTEKIREAKLTYNKYNKAQDLNDKYGITQSQVNTAHGIGAASGTGIGVASGLAIGALIGTHALPLVGTIIGAVVGAAAGALGGVLIRNQLIEKYKAAESIDDISLKKLEEQRAEIIKGIDTLKASVDANTESSKEQLAEYQQQLTAIEELTAAIKDRNSWVNNYTAQQNKLILEEGLLEAKVKNEDGEIIGYLKDMSVGQLWAMNPDDILKAYGDVVKDRLMGGVSVYVKDSDGNDTTELSAEFIKLALKAFKSDDELQQRFTARDLTLNEALSKLNTDNWLDKQQLQTFADALHVPISGLEDLTGKFGKLKLSDMLKTTTDLNEEMKKYSDLMASITDGTASMSSWITTIIQQFPELMQYTNDIPTLMNEIMIKISQLNTRYLEATWEEFADSKEYFTQIQPKILEQIPENQRQKARDYLNALSNSSISGLISYLSGADMGDEANQALKEAFIKIMESETVVSDLAKESQKQYFEFRVTEMNQELENLTQQRDMLKEINHQRKYENKLLEARNKLESAQTEKRRIYRAGVGWVYEADQEKIQEAQDNLKEIENEKDISALTKQIEVLTAKRDEWSTVWEKQSYALQQEMATQYEKAFGADGTLTSALTAVSQSMGSLAEAILKEKIDQRNRLLYGMKNGKKTEASLADLWNNYVLARGTSQENDALSLYTERAQKASAAGIDLSDWATQEKDNLSSISGTENTETPQPVDVAINPDAYRPAVAQKFVLSGGGNVASTGEITLEYTGGGVVGDFTTSLWKDIRASGDNTSAENKHRQDYARLWVLDKDGNPVDAGDFRELKKGYYAKYAPKGVHDLYGYAEQLAKIAGFNGVIIGGFSDDQNKWAYIDSQGEIWSLADPGVSNIMTNKETNKQKLSSLWKMFLDGLVQSPLPLPSHANGTLATSGEISLINELGTEAIITPQGTITALPGHTGIIPADITKNLWSLGELSPNILRALQMNILPDRLKTTSSMESITDQSLNISTLNMNVNADSSFDPQQFVQALKAQVALTRHLR